MARFSSRLATAFNVRPGEGWPLTLLLIHSFAHGLALVFLETPANTLFLSKFSVATLPYVYILTAVVSMLLGIGYAKAETRWSPAALLQVTLVAVCAITIAFYGALWLLEARWLAIGLMVWKDVWWALAGIEFWALAGFLFNVRQGKRLFGLVGAGEVIAGIMGGFAVPILLNDIGTLNLLLISIGGMLAALAVLTYTLRFAAPRFATEDESPGTNGTTDSIAAFFKDRYLRVFFGVSILSYMGYYFIDYVFYDRVEAAFPDEHQLASFFGIFFAVLNTFDLLSGTFMSGRLLTRYGLSFGLLMLPIADALSTGSAVVSSWLFGIAGVFLWPVVVTKLFDEVFRNSVQAHAFRILYQPWPVGQRLRVQTIRESIVEPMAIGLSGVLLLLCTSVASLSALHLLYIVLGLLAACVALSIVLRHEYTRVLLHALTKKRLRGLHVTLEDHSSLGIVQRGLESPNASEVIHCLQILEENEHPSLVSSLLQVIEHPEPKVRHYVLDRIGSLQLSPATDLVRQRVASETSAVVRGHALRTLCAIGDDAEIFERMPLYLDHPDHEVKQGALVGLLRSGGIDGVLTAGAHINNLLASPEAAERKLAAQVLGDVGIFHFYHPLLRLLRDSDLQVRKAALEAAGRVRNVKLVPLLLADLSDITVREEAFSALMQFGAEVIPALEVAFLRKEQLPETRICIARLCGRIGGAEAIAFFRQHLRFPDVSVRNHILSALVLCKYHAPPDERPSVEDAIRHEVEDATWAFATLDDLGAVAELAPLTQALLQAVKKHRERTLLLLSFIYPAEPVLQAKANLESDVSEKRASALEALDNLIAQHLKNLLFPLLDDITPEERLARFKAIFPQPKLSRAERLQDIVLHAHARSTAWTRTCALFAMGKSRLTACCESMIAAVADPDPVVRETAAWALYETDRTAYQQQVDILLVDPSPLVRRTLARLNVSRQEAGPVSS